MSTASRTQGLLQAILENASHSGPGLSDSFTENNSVWGRIRIQMKEPICSLQHYTKGSRKLQRGFSSTHSLNGFLLLTEEITFLKKDWHNTQCGTIVSHRYVWFFFKFAAEVLWRCFTWGLFPDGLDNKEFACNAGELGSVPGLGRSPGGGNATHSRILAWEIPWTEEPGGLQSMGLQRVGHDLVIKQQQSFESDSHHQPVERC